MNTVSYEQTPEEGRHGSLVLTGTYVLGRQIGRGGMGEVFEASHTRLPGRFAVKLLLPELVGNREAFARFCREAEIMSELRHPNIVQIFDFNTAPDGRPYFVMEYLEGRDLEARLGDGGPLPLPAVVRIVNAVGSALAAAHAHGVVHRDLKPSNIFLAAVDGQTDELVKVLDFGISKMRAATTRLSQSSEMLGTPSYMSPEQARGRLDEVDGRTDQFALGAIAYRMLTGQEAFQGDDSAAILYQVVHENPPPLAALVPETWDPRPLQAVLDRALAKEANRRWGGMMELARAFEDAAERTIDHPGTAPRQGARAAAVEANAAVLDEPPPVRPAPALRLVTPPPGRVPAIRGADDEIEPAAALDRERDWERRRSVAGVSAVDVGGTGATALDDDVADAADLNRLPLTHHRAAALGLMALGLAGALVATAWYRDVPNGLRFARDHAVAWTHHETVLPQPAATASQPAPATEPATAPEPAPTAPAASAPGPAAAAPAAAAPAPSTETAPSAPAPSSKGAASDEAAAAKPTAAPAAEEPHRHHHARRAEDAPMPLRPGVIQLVPERAPATAAPVSPAPATSAPFGGVKIAPPATQAPSRDLAPGEPGTGDETMPPSTP